MKAAYFILALTALVHADSLDAVLNRMDQAAKTFKSLTSDVHHVEYSDLFKETKPEDGTFKELKKTGVSLLAKFEGRDQRTIFMRGNKLLIYHPKANSYDEYDTRNFTKSADLLIMVGFGTPKADLLKKYDISLDGTETLGTKKTTRINLKPRSKEEKNFFNVIQLWIPDGEGNPIQEKVLTKEKDYNLLQFNNLKINPQISESEFEWTPPPGTKKISAGK